jgi:hypothetical protein
MTESILRRLVTTAVLCFASTGTASAGILSASLFNPLPLSGLAVTPVSLSAIPTPSNTTIVGTGYNVTFSTASNQGVVSGASPVHAIPVAGETGTTPEYLTGDIGSTLTTSPSAAGNYFSTGVGSITYTFSAPQTAFEVLWGSVDTFNSLTFNDAAKDVVTGTQVQSAAAGFTTSGSQAAGGSAYVLVNTLTPFTTVTAGSTGMSFELAGVVAGAVPTSTGGSGVTTPDPSSFLLLAAGMFAIGGIGIHTREKRKAGGHRD